MLTLLALGYGIGVLATLALVCSMGLLNGWTFLYSLTWPILVGRDFIHDIRCRSSVKGRE